MSLTLVSSIRQKRNVTLMTDEEKIPSQSLDLEKLSKKKKQNRRPAGRNFFQISLLGFYPKKMAGFSARI